ncbi:MAG: GNAT family N-acetyltransferase [Leeuwenhoekiella sp.]
MRLNLKYVVKTYGDLTKEELYKILRLRAQVFVVEQDCPYQDVDNKDQIARHVMGFKEDRLVAYTRLFKAGDYFKNASIGRVVVCKEDRKYGYGKDLMQISIEQVMKYDQNNIIEISAQKYLKNFYNDLGFQQQGDEYLEDNIPHILMIKSDFN